MNKKVRLGVIGAGQFSQTHIEGILNVQNTELVAICDKDIEKAKAKAEEYNIESYYSDYKEVLAREDIDAVTLALPDQVHKEISIAAMRAGKHVLCEKPMALDLDECKEMIKVAKETGKELMVGQIGRYTPSWLEGQRLLEAGVIGDLFLIESEYAHDYSKIGGDGGWRVTPEREPVIGGGCHAVDLIRMIAGDPTEVYAIANNKSLTDWPIHDCSLAVMKLPNDVIGRVMVSTGCKRKYTRRSTLYGTKGTIVFDNTSPTITLYKEQIADDAAFASVHGEDHQNIELKIPVPVKNHNFGGEVEDFCRCILEGKHVPTNGIEGASTVSVCLAIVESFKTGKPVKVDYNF